MTSIKENRYLRILIILLITPITGATVDIYVPSLPAISTYFNVPTHLVQLTVPSYLVGYSLSQVFCGALSDALGRWKILVIMMIIYILATFSATLSPNIYVLIAIRFIQGIAVAAPGVLSRAIASDSFESHELLKITNYINIAWGIGPIVAPAIGGYLQFYFGWQAPFYFLTAYALLNLLLIYFFLPETSRHYHDLKLNVLFGNYKKVLSHPEYLGGIIILAIIYGYLIFFNVMGPIIIQTVLKYSPIVYGHMALLLGLAWFFGSLCNRLLIKYYSPNFLIRFSLVINILACFVMWLLAISHLLNLIVLIIPALVIFFTGSIMFTNYFGKCIRLFPKMAGAASAAMGAFFVAGAAISGVIASILTEETQIPLTTAYVLMSLLILGINFLIRSRKRL